MELKQKYLREVKPHMMATFGYKSVMQVPKITKIVVNMTAGKDVTNAKAVDEVMQQLALITGQKPFKLTAKKSLAAFKLRAGMHVGGKVTIRGNRMWNFLEKLITINIPRVRDFRGVSTKQFDGRGNFAMGVPEQIIFPEIHYDKIAKVHGLDVMIVTTTNKDEEALELLRKLGVPFRKQKGGVRG